MYPRISVENRTVMQTTMCQRMDCRYQKSTRIRNTSAYRLLFFAILTLWTVQQAHSSPRTRTREVFHWQNPGPRGIASNNRERSRVETIGESRRNVNHRNIPIPPMFPVRMESCVGKTYCEEVENYPQDFVREILRRHDYSKLFSGVTVESIDDETNSNSEAESLCDSEIQVKFPKMGLSDKGEWRTILQDAENGFEQGVQVEKCQDDQLDKACKIIDNPFLGFKTECKQKYGYVGLFVVPIATGSEEARIKVPASCCCQLRRSG